MCQGFNHFSGVFASFCIAQISHHQHMGLTYCSYKDMDSTHGGWYAKVPFLLEFGILIIVTCSAIFRLIRDKPVVSDHCR